MTKPKKANLEDWLRCLDLDGPSSEGGYQIKSLAKRLGYVDYLVRHKGTKEVCLLQDMRAKYGASYYRSIEYLDNKLALTPEGRRYIGCEK